MSTIDWTTKASAHSGLLDAIAHPPALQPVTPPAPAQPILALTQAQQDSLMAYALDIISHTHAVIDD